MNFCSPSNDNAKRLLLLVVEAVEAVVAKKAIIVEDIRVEIVVIVGRRYMAIRTKYKYILVPGIYI